MDILKHVVFRTAEDMREVHDRSAQLVVMSPAYFEDEDQERHLLENIFRECNRIVTGNGVVAAAFTDYKRRGGTYPKHLVVCDAARANGFEVYDHRIVVWSFQKLLMQKGYYHVYVFKRAGEKCFCVKRNAYPPYNFQTWVLMANQQVLGFADALDPEIYELLVKKFTREGDLVVLPFAGSATGVIMALKLGRKAVGYEIDPKRKTVILAREKQLETRAHFSPTSPIELFEKGLTIRPELVAKK